MKLNDLTAEIIHSAINVHKELGPGLLESVYQACLFIELQSRGIQVEKEMELPVYYRGTKITGQGFRLDLLVENKIILELKSVEKIREVHVKQLLTYLRLAEKPLGLLINFNVNLVKNGIVRLANCPPSPNL